VSNFPITKQQFLDWLDAEPEKVASDGHHCLIQSAMVDLIDAEFVPPHVCTQGRDCPINQGTPEWAAYFAQKIDRCAGWEVSRSEIKRRIDAD
jgi:hypothetical protein